MKAILIEAEGNSGEVLVKIGTDIVLPLWVSNFNRIATSPSLRLRVPVGEAVTVTTAGRGSDRTFVGITYIESR